MPDHLFIVGAGFSRNAGLPLASNFTQELLETSAVKPTGASVYLVNTMRTFVNDIFGNGNVVEHADWPQLEDLFTTIDLAANTGHNLGSEYTPSDLRSIRRMLIIRVIRMLRIAFNKKKKKPDDERKQLEVFFSKIKPKHTAFLSMNWDTVIEELMTKKHGPFDIDYGCGAIAASANTTSVSLRRGPKPSQDFSILKPHGSVNWMYCDSCSRLYWFPAAQTEYVAKHLFKDSDASVVARLSGTAPPSGATSPSCPHCKATALGTRFATFSYRKALEFPMHQATWSRGEEYLQDAKDWIFFGYSLPAADYQFKHLLKRVYLSRAKKPIITLITKGTTDPTILTYKRFFGESAILDKNVVIDGMSAKTIAHLSKRGVLNL